MGMSESAGVDDKVEAFTQMLAEGCQQLAGMNGDAGRKAEPMDTMNVPKALITASIDLENLDCGDIPHMYLGSTNLHAGDANGPGNRTDGLSYQADGSRGLTDGLGAQTDTLSVSDSPEMVSISHGDDLGT